MKCGLIATAASALAMVYAGGVVAQSYPQRPIRFIVPYAPGGGTDIVARIAGQKLSEAWGQAVIIDNRPGAGSTLGTELAAKAQPDGYTMVLSSISLAFNIALYKNLSYDPVQDLAPVSLVATQPNLLVINASVPANNVKELIALAKSKAGALNYASGGYGSGPHLAAELLKLQAGIDINHVPYKGTGPALVDLISGQVQMMVAVIASALPYVKNGRLRALGVTGSTRSPSTPDIPTLAEAGVPNYEFNTWYGIQVAAKTPPAVIAKLNAEISRILKLPDVRERFAAGGLDPYPSTPDEFKSLIRSEIVKWAKVAKASGAKPE